MHLLIPDWCNKHKLCQRSHVVPRPLTCQRWIFLCVVFSLATGMMEWDLCYTKAVLFQFFKHCLQIMSLFSVEVRERLPEQTTKVKVPCFCLLMKPQHWCFCLPRLKHQGPDPDPLLVLGTSVTQEKRLPCSHVAFSALFQPLLSRGLFSFSPAYPPWYVHLQPDGQKMQHGQREGM